MVWATSVFNFACILMLHDFLFTVFSRVLILYDFWNFFMNYTSGIVKECCHCA